MSAGQSIETEVEDSTEFQESTSKVSAATKLERRRRIEELDEERKLRQELSEF